MDYQYHPSIYNSVLDCSSYGIRTGCGKDVKKAGFRVPILSRIFCHSPFYAEVKNEELYRVFQKELYVCTPLSVNVFVTLATQ
jgi:hypothetical protein